MQDSPPRWVNRLLERLLPEDVAEALVGDLLEEYALRARSTRAGGVSGWYWMQIVGSAAPLLCSAVARGRWPLTLGVGFAAYAFAEAVEVAVDAANSLLEPSTAAHTIPILIVGLAAIVLAGYLAAWIRPGAAAALALVVAVTAAVQLLTATEGMPLWYRLVSGIAGPFAAAAGGALFARRHLRAEAFRRRRTDE
jgi:hypothetical protein